MADVSAAALAEMLIEGCASRSHRSLAEALSGDPPLLLWTVCSAARHEDCQPASVAEAAGWLAGRGLEVLQWGPDEADSFQTPHRVSAEQFAEQVAQATATAELAAELASPEGEAVAQRAFLLGLLRDAPRWLTLTATGAADNAVTCLPPWLRELHRETTPALTAVKLAAGMLAGETAVLDTAIDLETCRSRAAEMRRRWLEPAVGLADWLPRLAAKLRRLEELENCFQQTLETEKLAALAEFAAGAGHEINNPLTVIAGRAQLFLQEETDPERRRALALIVAQAMRVYEMIADMRLFARPPRPEIETVDIVELVDRLIENFSPRAAGQETVIGRTGEAGPLLIDVDPTQFSVALGALCQNAFEALQNGGHIEIGVRRSGQDAVIEVADDGPGIPPDVRRHLFDPFYSARQAGRGLGLGLSKCWRIITNHGGRIEVDSTPGQGAKFAITLPAVAAR